MTDKPASHEIEKAIDAVAAYRKPAATTAASSSRLGRLVCQRRQKRLPFVFGVPLIGLFGFVGVLFAMMAVASARFDPAHPMFWRDGAPLSEQEKWFTAWLAIPLLLAAAFIWRSTGPDTIFSFFQHGVARSHAGKVEELPYESVTGIAYRQTQMYRNGAYQRTQVALELVPDRSLGIKPFSFRDRHAERQFSHGFLGPMSLRDDIEVIVGHVSELIAKRLLERIHTGEIVRWFGNVSLARDSLHVGSRKYAWSEIESVDLREGKLALKVRGKFFRHTWRTGGVLNFPPGFIVLNTLRKQSSG